MAGKQSIPLYGEIRFRKITPEYIVDQIAASCKYNFVDVEDNVVDKKNAVQTWRCGSRVRLGANGRTITNFPQHGIRVQRLIGLGGVGFVNPEGAFLEIQKIIGVGPSYKHNKQSSVGGLRIHYDVATLENKYPLERITIEVLLRPLR